MQRAVFVTVLVLVAALPVSFGAPFPVSRLPCEAQQVAGLGLVCERQDGLLDLYSSSGTFLGTTHGADASPTYPSPAVPGAVPVPPTCVQDAPDGRFGVVVYAVASDQPDRFEWLLPALRSVVNLTNGDFRISSDSWGVPIDLKMLCDNDGLVVVHHAVLPTPNAESDFGTILTDLFALGLIHPRAKNWIQYDDPSYHLPFSGVGTFNGDDRVMLGNLNNNGGGIAMSVKNVSDFVFLHELGHTMGAVPVTSSHTSGSAHCNDGLDVMCYADHGPFSNYSTTACSEYAWDCGNDDYFAPAPVAGSYLDTHWNVGGSLNRFLRVGNLDEPATMRSLQCDANTTTLRCTFAATAPTPDLSYEVTWPDGVIDRVPPVDSAPEGAVVTASHDAPADAGAYVVTVSATSSRGVKGSPMSFDPSTVPPNQAPTISSFECPAVVAANVYFSCAVSGSDDGPSVRFFVDWGAPGASASTWWVNPAGPRALFGSLPSSNESGFVNVTASVYAVDDGTPALASAPEYRVIRIETPRPMCFFDASGNLFASVPVLDFESIDTTSFVLPPECPGHPFDLTGGGWDFDVCFRNETAALGCNASPGDEHGDIPMGATRAVIVLSQGVSASFRFRARE